MFFWNSLAFLVIHWVLAIWTLVPLPFLKSVWTYGSSRFTYCWSLAWRILSITLLACAAVAAAKLLQSCPTLCDPINGGPPGSTVPGILQARTLEWVCHFLLQCMKVNCESAALNMPANLENSAVATGLEKVSFHSNPKENQCQRMLKLVHNCTHLTMAPCSSTLALKIPWTEEPGRLQSTESLRVWHDWATSLSFFTFMHCRRKWNPLQCSCLENPRDGRDWWAAVFGAAQSRTRLKRLSSTGESFERRAAYSR